MRTQLLDPSAKNKASNRIQSNKNKNNDSPTSVEMAAMQRWE